MKKVIPLKPRPRKEPTYTPREEIALKNADSIVMRVRISGKWKERAVEAPPGSTLLSTLEFIQHQLRHSPDVRGVVLYVGGADPKTGERMIAAVPHDWVPENVRRYLARKEN